MKGKSSWSSWAGELHSASHPLIQLISTFFIFVEKSFVGNTFVYFGIFGITTTKYLPFILFCKGLFLVE